MYFVVDSRGKFWDGFGWAARGKPFLTVSAATRSLYEEGESLEKVQILEAVKEP
jgi:hypothetical protein